MKKRKENESFKIHKPHKESLLEAQEASVEIREQPYHTTIHMTRAASPNPRPPLKSLHTGSHPFGDTKEIQPRDRWVCKYGCMRRDLRLLQMNVNINFHLPAIIPSSVPQKLKNHLPIALSERGRVWGSRRTKVASLCVILHSVREEDAETIQPTGHHRLIQRSFISPLD